MNENKILGELKKKSIKTMKKGLFYHDHVHVAAVYSNVKKLLKFERGNRLVLLTAALFHDIKRNLPNPSVKGSEYTKKLLISTRNFPQNLVDRVVEVIKTHTSGPKKNDEKIFFDADKMDAFSNLGLARTFMIYAKEGFSLEEAARDYIKFVDKKYKSLNTTTAKKLAREDYKKCRLFALEILKKYK